MTASVFGWVLLAALTLFVAIDAVAVARRTAPSGRAELAIVASLVFFALIALPVMVLGYARVLSAARLAIASFVLSLAVFVTLARSGGVREELRACDVAARSLLFMPLDGLREAARARSFVLIGLLWAAGVIALSAWLTVVSPSESWDGFFYHEPMVGYAIQNHGFGTIELPANQAVQAANGYPRLCESIALWFVIFTDKTLIEIPNTLAAPPLMFAVYAIARRFGDRLLAATWASVALLMPAMWSQLRASYIDVEVAFFLIAALFFATRPAVRMRDAACATLAMALLMGSKSSALAWIPPLAAVAYGRLMLRHVRARFASTLATIALGTLLVAAIAAVTLVKNWLAFKNPLWPIRYDSDALGVHWPGLITLSEMAPDFSPRELSLKIWGVPEGGVGDLIQRSYGYAVPWLAVPLGAAALIVAVVAFIRDRARGKRGGTAAQLLLVALPALIALKTTPSLWIARYNMHLAVTFMFAVSWLVAGERWSRTREGIAAVAIAFSIVPFFWTRGWCWAPSQDVKAHLYHPFAARSFTAHSSFDFLSELRERELGAGDRVVYTQEVACVGALWNFHFSNDVAYVSFDDDARFFARIAELRPKWIATGGEAKAALELRTTEWETLGRLTAVDDTVVFRRRTLD